MRQLISEGLNPSVTIAAEVLWRDVHEHSITKLNDPYLQTHHQKPNDIHIHNDIKYRPCLILKNHQPPTTNQPPKRPTYKAPLVVIQHMISTTVINIQVELLSTWSEIRKLSG